MLWLERFRKSSWPEKIGSWGAKHNGTELCVAFGLSVNALIFTAFKKYYPIRMPSDIWSTSVALGQAMYCVVSPFIAYLIYSDMKKHSRLCRGKAGLELIGNLMIVNPITFVIVTPVPSVATIAISALIGYVGKFAMASKKGAAAVALGIPCLSLCLWKLNMTLKRQAAERRFLARAARMEQEEKRMRERQQKEQEAKEKEKLAKEAARQVALEAAKADALAKFDAAAKDGKIEKLHFRDALQPYVQELVQRVPVEEALKNEKLGPLKEVAMNLLPVVNVAREDAAHVVDCEKFVELLFGLIDSNGDGSIERSELEHLIDELLKLGAEADPRKMQQSIAALAFRFVDRNKDGKLELSELEFLLKVILELTGFAATTCLHVANAIVEAPVVEEEIAKMIKLPPWSGRKELLEWMEPLKARRKALAPEAFWCEAAPLDPAVVYKGLLSMVDAVMAIHHATESSAGNLLTNFYMTVNQLLRGGINEESFVGTLAPMIKKRMTAKPDLDRLKNCLQAVKTSQGGAWPNPECEELEGEIVSAVEKHWDTVQHTIVAAQSNAADVASSFSHALFELADIDGDGKISQREISVIKAFFNSFVEVVVILTLHHESVSTDTLPEDFKSKLEELCPAAFSDAVDDKEAHLINLYTDSLYSILADGFDFLDKNADGKVTKEEVASLIVKFLRVGLQLLQSVWGSYFAGASAFSLDALMEVWKQADITEVSLENLPVVAASVKAIMSL